MASGQQVSRHRSLSISIHFQEDETRSSQKYIVEVVPLHGAYRFERAPIDLRVIEQSSSGLFLGISSENSITIVSCKAICYGSQTPAHPSTRVLHAGASPPVSDVMRH